MQPQFTQSYNDKVAGRFTLNVYVTVALIIGSAYLGQKVLHGASWMHIVYYGLFGLAMLNVLYYGWVRKTVTIGRTASTVTGGWAVAVSFLYILFILAVGGSTWNFIKPTPASPASSSVTTH